MADKFTDENFGSPEKLLAYIKEKSDDIDKALIFGPGAVLIASNGKRTWKSPEFGMMFAFVNGEQKMMGSDDAEMVLNEGILTRMKIKIEFLK